MSLAHDIARCPGIGMATDGIETWHRECEDCQRRTDPGGDYTPHMAPPPIIVFECESYIPPR